MLTKLIRMLRNPHRVPDAAIRLVKSALLTYKLTGRVLPLKVRVVDRRVKPNVHKAKGAKVHLGGTLTIGGWFGHADFIFIGIGPGATFETGGDFYLGSGSRVFVAEGAKLLIGGCQNESQSGITERGIILCHKSIAIGKDFLGAWGLFITDSDSHQYGENNPPMDVTIGDHVWMCPNSSVLKGSRIGSHSVITQAAVISKQVFPERSLIGGNRATRIGEAKEWHR